MGFALAHGLQNGMQSWGNLSMNRICVAIAAVAMLPALAHAQSFHQTAAGSRLEVRISCARHIEVTADPTLSGQVVIDAAAAHPEEIAQIDFSGGPKIVLKSHGECWQNNQYGNFQPTLDIKLHVPAAFPLSLEASSDTTYNVAVGGPLNLDISGSAQLDITKVTALSMDVSGSGDVRIADVSGPINLDSSGSGKLLIGHGDASAVVAKISGSGEFHIDTGTVGQLAVNGSGSGEVTLGGTVGNAVIDLSGSGDVSIGKLTGQLAQNTSGSGTVHVSSR